jgi:two-component system KDP operon response regulator KdpE
LSASAALILVVDDDPAIREGLTRELAAAGYEAIAAADGVEGQERFGEVRPDLVVTDLAMPRAGGLALIAAIRRLDRAGQVPILVLSVRGEEEDKVQALDLGADDFVTKPFALGELLARVRAQLRRRAPAAVVRFPGLEIDFERRRVLRAGEELHLTPKEFAILELLARHAGRPVSVRQIIAAVWRGAPGTSTDAVRVQVGSLRRKLEPDPAGPRYVATEPWVGYRLLPEPLD